MVGAESARSGLHPGMSISIRYREKTLDELRYEGGVDFRCQRRYLQKGVQDPIILWISGRVAQPTGRLRQLPVRGPLQPRYVLRLPPFAHDPHFV